MPISIPIPPDSICAEIVIAPLNDPQIAEDLELTVEQLSGTNVNSYQNWCWYVLGWEDAAAGEPAASLTVACERLSPRFDQLISGVSAPTDVTIVVEALIDGHWHEVGQPAKGEDARKELTGRLVPGELNSVRFTFTPDHEGISNILIHWVGLADSVLLGHFERGRISWDEDWTGLLKPTPTIAPTAFSADLLFSANDLPALRAKKALPGWKDHFSILEARAQRAIQSDPEAQLTDFAPFTDKRYTRGREHGRWNYYHEGVVVAFVGLINQDADMLRWAGRTLMCMTHTTHWCQSAESRLPGSTWNQRCFVEEMMTSSAALLADWLDFMLTERAAELVRRAIWDKGLAVVERDVNQNRYMFNMNQGPWFCRARILGGLLLSKRWSRWTGYVDNALADLREGMDRYVMADGGTHEGLGYWSLTMHMVLQGLLAYARDRDCDVRTLLPKNQAKTEAFLGIMSAMEPGLALMDGDNSTDYLVGDTIPILASLFPDSAYASITSACLLRERPPTYYNTYVLDGVFSLVFGPDHLAPARSIVPTFGRLELTGHLTSCRYDGENTMRVHLAGARAGAGHSHLDKSGVTIELDGEPVLIDRGVVRYDDPRCGTMNASSMHNVVTPVLHDGSFPNQILPATAVIPQGKGDDTMLHAHIDVSAAWETLVQAITRELQSENPRELTVIDEGELTREEVVAFHLHAPAPFVIEGDTAVVCVNGKRLAITLPWAETITQAEDGINFQFKPVFHLIAKAAPLTRFKLTTQIVRQDPA